MYSETAVEFHLMYLCLCYIMSLHLSFNVELLGKLTTQVLTSHSITFCKFYNGGHKGCTGFFTEKDLLLLMVLLRVNYLSEILSNLEHFQGYVSKLCETNWYVLQVFVLKLLLLKYSLRPILLVHNVYILI